MQQLINIGNCYKNNATPKIEKQHLTNLDIGTRILQHIIKIGNWYKNNATLDQNMYKNNAIPDQYW